MTRKTPATRLITCLSAKHAQFERRSFRGHAIQDPWLRRTKTLSQYEVIAFSSAKTKKFALVQIIVQDIRVDV